MDRLFRALVWTAAAAGAVAVAVACGSDGESQPPKNDPGGGGRRVAEGGVTTGWNLVLEEGFKSGFGGLTQAKRGSGELSTTDGAVSARTGDAPGVAYLAWQPPTPISYEALRIELSVMPMKLGSPTACIVSVGGVRLQLAPPAIHRDRDDSDAGDAGGEEHAFDAQVPLEKWSTVSVELTFGTSPHARVLYDDVEVHDGALDGELPRIDRPEIAIGLSCEETNAEMLFDEVAIYAR